ncbi:hypothetical protein [Pedobacter miscanthi]|uniref:Uncharacterized protein n=1 Tax=Pedobacter miscanthi TaxID=2259170 RepID=A0A366KMT6_9SPHI|nr:hypothetical protein [Pedobacter miscanthi]RBQ02818.1 hypothetical protein DRW42_24520 [Pedobacter miscanthi]
MRITHVDLHDVAIDCNKILEELGSHDELKLKPNGSTTTILSKNINSGEVVELYEDIVLWEGYAFLNGYATALKNLKVESANVTYDNETTHKPSKTLFGIFKRNK